MNGEFVNAVLFALFQEKYELLRVSGCLWQLEPAACSLRWLSRNADIGSELILQNNIIIYMSAERILLSNQIFNGRWWLFVMP